jgi:U3 small nucleolar RNA-associated protein 13
MTYKRLHTLPVYENVEAVQILPNFHFYYKGKDESINKDDIVIATAGSKGVVKLWKSTRKEIEGEIIGSISGLKLLNIQDASSAFGEKRGGYTGLLLTSHKHNVNRASDDVLIGGSEELIAIDAEHNISFLNITNVGDDSGVPLLNANRTIIGHNDEILDLKIIPNLEGIGGDDERKIRRVAVATNSAQVRVFELGSYSCQVLEGHNDTVLSIDVSPCGRYLATSGKDQTMRIWHLKTGKCVAVATGHTEAVGAAAFSRKIGRFDVAGKAAKNGGGSFAVTASKDKTLKRWNLPGSTCLDNIGTSNEDSHDLHVFISARAHEKVRGCYRPFYMCAPCFI